MSEFTVDESKSRPEQAQELQTELERIAQEGGWEKPSDHSEAAIEERLTPGQMARINELHQQRAGRRGGETTTTRELNPKIAGEIAQIVRQRFEAAEPEDYQEHMENDGPAALNPDLGKHNMRSKYLDPDAGVVDARAKLEDSIAKESVSHQALTHAGNIRADLQERISDVIYLVSELHKRNPVRYDAMDAQSLVNIAEQFSVDLGKQSRAFKELQEIQDTYEASDDEAVRQSLQPSLDTATQKYDAIERQIADTYFS